MANILQYIDESWTLFLDRDGVINIEKKDDYIRNKSEFIFYDTSLEALKILSGIFTTIILVTNQRGIGRGLMTEDDLSSIHTYMLEALTAAGGRIDKIYYCTAVEPEATERKPNPGMAFKAKQEYAHIDFSKSIIAGNKLSDMQFGRNANMHTVYIATTHPEVDFPHPLIDLRYNNLYDFAIAAESTVKKNHK